LDTNLERDVLHRKILPDLQKKAQQHEVQVIIYDMRFGVKDENTKDHMTWVACKEAIQQCHEGCFSSRFKLTGTVIAPYQSI
jgi:23S rRNA U2552 (ribose-2'-O)-methylase RlmE/FtsJ